MSKLDSKDIADRALESVRKWLETFVIGLGLCPFASKPYKNYKVRFAYFDGSKNDWLAILMKLKLHCGFFLLIFGMIFRQCGTKLY